MPFKAQLYSFYEALDQSQDSFRLCKLLPAERKSLIRCELVNDWISARKGVYSALSYTWGEALESRWIILDGKPYHVQPNLQQALKAIRERDTELLIWVDAICINQKDLAERNHQVSLMGDIYRSAKCVLAWLGPAADDSDAYFDYLEHLAIADRASQKQVEESVTRAVSFLNKRPYWRRAWIKQELILAKDITVYCGCRVQSGESFFWFATFLTIDLAEGYDDYMSKVYIHRCSKPETLEELLHRYNNSECFDRRDRVFALLSMASDCKGLESRLVDYSLSVPALFFAFIAHLKPSNLLGFATNLQDVLGVRRVELLKYWKAISADDTINASSHLEELAFDYIRKVENYGKSLASDCLISAPQIVTQSFIAVNTPEMLSQKDKLFRIEGTELFLRVRPTLFGYLLQDVYKITGEVESDKQFSLEVFSPPFTMEQVWKYMIVSTLTLGRDKEHLWDPVAIAQVKGAVVKNHGPDISKPHIDTVCYTLAELRRRESLKEKCPCLVDCRYVVSALYGHSLMRPIDW